MTRAIRLGASGATSRRTTPLLRAAHPAKGLRDSTRRGIYGVTAGAVKEGNKQTIIISQWLGMSSGRG
jgi:hypothetical protein